jgi:hypothetical protein
MECSKAERDKTKPSTRVTVDAGGNANFKSAKHSTGSRAVQIGLVSFPPIKRRNHKGLTLDTKSDTGKKACVQDLPNRVPVVRSVGW